jgi:hypothetical protein
LKASTIFLMPAMIAVRLIATMIPVFPPDTFTATVG